MTTGASAKDALDRWLSTDGVAVLDGITGHARDMIGVVDRDLRVRYVNWTVPGSTRQAVVGHSVLCLIPLNYQKLAREAFQRVLRSGESEQFETLYRDEHDVLDWLVRVAPIRQDDEVIGLITISTDMTSQRRADIDRDRFFALSLDMMVVASHDGKLKHVNPALCDALGFTAEQILTMGVLSFVHPDDRERTRAISAQVRAGMALGNFENRYRARDGSYRVFSWRATVDPLTADIYAVARDITEQRSAEAQLRQAQKMEALGQLAGGVAHDFNNLMQAVLANAHVALRGAPPAVAEHLHEISGAGRRAADLTRQLLLFSQRQGLYRTCVDVNELLRTVMNLLRRLIPENITIELNPAHELSAVDADRTQLEQVIINLCVNARDAMLNGGTLTIETENVTLDERDCRLIPGVKPGRYVRIRVSDTGEGINPELHERIFEPFFTTKGKHHGTGLGLATVYSIVREHGGHVHVQSEVGHGATFKVDLPADDRPAVSETRTRSTMPPAPDDTAQPNTETILVAEDEPIVARPVIRVLQDAGYRVLAARNGREAVELLREHLSTVDLALLDIVMPILGGPQAWLQMQQVAPNLRVLFMSGYADDRYRRHLPIGAKVLSKPFNPEALLAAIRRTLDAPR